MSDFVVFEFVVGAMVAVVAWLILQALIGILNKPDPMTEYYGKLFAEVNELYFGESKDLPKEEIEARLADIRERGKLFG